MSNRNYPTSPGLYWARGSQSEGWYRYVVRVGGEPPFLKISWAIDDITDDVRKMSPYDLYFGPEITRPDVPTKEIKK